MKASLVSRSPILVATRASLDLLDARRRRRFLLTVLAQMATGFLDLVGILLIGVVGVLAATTSQGSALPESLESILDTLGLNQIPPTTLAVTLSAVAAVLLLTKGFVYAALLRSIYRFLGRSQFAVSSDLTRNVIDRRGLPPLDMTSQRIVFAVLHGVYQAIPSLLGSMSIVAAEATLLLLVGGVLFFLDPILMTVISVYFLGLGIIVHRVFARRAERYGKISTETYTSAHQLLQESLQAHREITVGGRQSAFIGQIDGELTGSTDAAANVLFLGQMPKLIYESALVIAAVIVVGWQVISADVTTALATLVLFLAASARLLPSILRLNGQLISARGSGAQAQPTYDLAAFLRSEVHHSPRVRVQPLLLASDAKPQIDLEPELRIVNVSYRYPGSDTYAIRQVSLEAPAGATIALVGRSGAGKSTLADLILGIIEPQEGEITVGGKTPHQALLLWPGQISYLPQHVTLLNSTVRANVLLGLDPAQYSDDAIWAALQDAQIADAVRDARLGLDGLVGEHGVHLSGGQRQRLGLARALLTHPRLIVFDEATSSLDAETEVAVNRTLSSLPKYTSRVVVAHRLATVQAADTVVYLDQGRIEAVGSFDQVRRESPSFDSQARLLGLT